MQDDVKEWKVLEMHFKGEVKGAFIFDINGNLIN